MRYFFLLCLALVSAACQKSDSISPDTLTGRWIEQTMRQDTLTFNLDHTGSSLPDWLTVNRGKERTATGDLIPKIGSGMYTYQVRGDRIFVRNMLSSSSMGAEYAIERKGDVLRVDNFYELGFRQSPTATRILVRLP